MIVSPHGAGGWEVQDGDQRYLFDAEAQARVFASTGKILSLQEALVEQINPLIEWHGKAKAILALMDGGVLQAYDINDFFRSNPEIMQAIIACFVADPTGNGLVTGLPITGNTALKWMSVMMGFERLLDSNLEQLVLPDDILAILPEGVSLAVPAATWLSVIKRAR